MEDYCDILRSHLPTDTLAVEVYRPTTDEVLDGQLNGRSLEVVTSFEAQFDEEVATDTSGGDYSDYVTISDDSGLISVSVPAEWSDVDGRQWSSDLATGTTELIGPALGAAPDLAAWRDSWGTPGVFIAASAMITTSVSDTLDQFDFTGDCSYDARYDYDDGVYTGMYDLYTNCGDEGSLFFNVIAEPADQSWIGLVQIVALTDADLAAADEIFNTFVVGDLAG
jgi:serine protease Do